MQDRRQHLDSELALDVRGVARQAALHSEERFAAEKNGLAEQSPILIAEVAELRFAEAGGER